MRPKCLAKTFSAHRNPASSCGHLPGLESESLSIEEVDHVQRVPTGNIAQPVMLLAVPAGEKECEELTFEIHDASTSI